MATPGWLRINLGAKIAVRTVRQYCARNNSDGQIILRIDFSNAFICISRAAALKEVRGHFPRLARWACYAVRSNLVFGTHTLDSLTGVQQGDPLDLVIFYLVAKGYAAHPKPCPTRSKLSPKEPPTSGN